MMPHVLIENLSFNYPDGTPVLDHFSCSLTPGSRVGLLGSNGAGKTTLALILAGFLGPSQGRIMMDGQDLLAMPIEDRRRRLGFTFHNPDDQLFMPTVIDDVCFGPLNQGQAAGPVREQAMALLTRLEIADLAPRFPGHLSAGQKRLVALAGALILEPRLLVLDEPTAFLDPHARQHIMELLSGLAPTTLIITHDLDLAVDLCDQVIILHQGRAVTQGAPDGILSDAALMKRCHLAVPYQYKHKK